MKLRSLLVGLAVAFAFLLLLEGGLRLLGVGAEARTPFQEVPGRPDYLVLSPDYAARYFNGFRPGVAFTPFAAEKAPDAFRVFVMGGSSTAGFPYHFYYGFPARLEARLAALAPGRRVEVVNLGMTAVSSFTLWDLREAVAAHAPDAVVIYAGHNEYYGAYGAGSTVYSLGNRLWLKRLTLRLGRTALYSALQGLILGGAPPEAPPQERTMMASVVRDAGIALGGDVYQAGLRQYAANLGDAVATFTEAGVPVFLGTLVANLADQPPLGEDAGATAAYERGRRLLADGDSASARAAFAEARDLDPVRFRAPAAANGVLRDLGGRSGVTLVDLEAIFRSRSPGGVEGGSFFDDHLHPNHAGYDLMAASFFEAMRGHPRLQPGAPVTDPGPQRLDPFEEAYADLQIARLKGGYPFTRGLTASQEAAAYDALLDRYLSSGRPADARAVRALTTPLTIQEALREALTDARAASDTLNALLYYRSIFYWQPFNEALMEQAVSYALSSPSYDAVVAELALLAANRTSDVYALNALAAVRLRQGRLAEARAVLAAVEAHDPNSNTMLFNTARLLVLQGDTTTARRYFERYRATR